MIGANMIKKYSSYADANIPGLDFLEDVDIGKRVRVTISRESGGVVSKDFIVRGIIKSKVDEVSTRAFITSAELKRMIPVNKTEYQEITVRTDYEYAPELVRQTKAFMGTSAARIQTSDEAIPSFLRDIESTMGVLGNALSSIALVVASITIFIVIYVNAVTKRKYIGIMKGIALASGHPVILYYPGSFLRSNGFDHRTDFNFRSIEAVFCRPSDKFSIFRWYLSGHLGRIWSACDYFVGCDFACRVYSGQDDRPEEYVRCDTW